LLLGSFYTLSQLALPYAEDASGRATMDERQIQVSDRAFYRAYQILSAVFGLWVVYEAIARTNSRGWLWRPETFDEYQALVWGYLLLSMTLPSAFIAWTEPDPPEDSPRRGGPRRSHPMKVEHAAPSSPLLTSPPVAGASARCRWSRLSDSSSALAPRRSTCHRPSLVLFLSLLAVSIALNGAIGARWLGGRSCNGTSWRPSASSAR